MTKEQEWDALCAEYRPGAPKLAEVPLYDVLWLKIKDAETVDIREFWETKFLEFVGVGLPSERET